MNNHYKLFFFTLLIVYVLSLKGIGLNPIKPYHLNQGKSTSYIFSIQPQEEILTKAKIKITFPNQFDYTKLAANLYCMVKSQTYYTQWTSIPCKYSNSSVIILLQVLKNQATQVWISQLSNPIIYTMSSYFSICLMFDNTITTCSKQFGKVVFPSIPKNTPSNLTYPSISSLNSLTVGQSSTYQFNFTLTQNYSVNNTIRIKFPPGYTTTSNPICQMSGQFNQVIKTFLWPDKRSIQCQMINSTFVANANQILKIIGIYNPNYQGIFGNTDQGFVIEILKGTTTISLEQIKLKSQITISAGILNGKIVQQNNFIKSNTKYTFYINLQNSLIQENYIRMKFDKSFILYNNQCSVISGLKMASNSILSCKNSTDSSFTYMTVKNFQSASITNQIVLSLMVNSPSIEGVYDVQIITGNNKGVMDRMISTISLNSTYGMMEMLSINAITANSKVKVGKTGPLQLTFFLNYQLPQTNVLTQGKFILKIYPPIPEPPPLINGVLKCYYFNDIPAQTCTWDNIQSALYTKVTIKTPQIISYQYSQIPITITTQGAVNDSMIGITIADVVTRYRFQLQAYKQQNTTTPTQVFYSEYIADAIEMSLTYYSLTNQMNQYTHFRFQFVGPYTFPTNYADNIRLKIQFLNYGAWADNLGYQANKIYKRFPCVFSQNSLLANPPVYNPNIACDLYTFLNGPHASLTDQDIRGPYILVYGFTNQLFKDYNYRLQVGKFLISSSSNTQAKIRFSVIQQTPSMLTKYIQLYYNEFTAFTTVNSTVTFGMNSFTTSMSNSKIKMTNTHTNTFTTSSNAFAVVYEYDQSSTQSFNNKNFECSTDRYCVSLGYPVNWIIQYVNSGTFPTVITSQFLFINGIYSSSFLGIVRAFKSNMTTIYKSTFTYIYTTDVMTGYNFWFNQTKIYKGMQQYYRVCFITNNAIPVNGFIRLTLSNEIKFGINPFCVSSYLQAYDVNLGVLCELQNQRSTLKIYNLAAITVGTYYEIQIRLVSQLTATSPIRPTINIQTFRQLDIDNSVVDQVSNLFLNNSYILYYNNPIQFQIKNPRTISDNPKNDYIGRFQIKFRPSSSVLSAPASKIRLYFHDHAWNGGKFTVPNNNVNDPLVCMINRQRIPCTYSINPLNILLDIESVGLNTGSDNLITIDTQFIAPQNGLKHPSQAGQYMNTLHFYYSNMTQIQKSSFIHKIKPRTLRNLVIRSTVNDIGVENMFQIWFQTWSNLTVNPNNHNTMYSRIFIQFPTKDSLGNILFDDDLGGYKETGQYVGCSFHWSNSNDGYVKAATDYMKCRLIKSQVQGDPVKVQIINHGAFSSTDRYMRVFIAKVFNPSIAITSLPITLKIEHVQVSSNNVYELYQQTYDVFMNTQTPTPLSNKTSTCRTNSFQDSSDVNDVGYFVFDVRKIGSTSITTPQGFYYALDMTDSLKPRNIQMNTVNYCNNSYYYGCYIFPQINYIVIHAYQNNFYVQIKLNIGNAISQVDTKLVGRVWQNGRFMGYEQMILSASNWYEIVGNLYSFTITTVGSSQSQNLNKRRQQMLVQFRLDNAIPAGGSIQIVWPSSIPKVYPHCRSMTNIGSQLYAQGQIYNGQIGCMVQNTRNWVITSFQALNAGSYIKILGEIQFPQSSSYLGAGYIYTYNNTHSTNIRTNGFIIDYLYDTNFNITVQNSKSWNIDSQITVQETLPLRVNYIGPLQLKFQLTQNLIGPKAGRIVVRIWKKSTLSQSNGFTWYDKKYVCKITQLSTSQETGCVVQKAQEDNLVSGNQNIKFTIYSSSTLNSINKYKLIITTQQGIRPQGIIFPSVPGLYKVSLSIDTDSNTDYNVYNQLYLQVYGTSFKTLKITSMVTLPSEMNLIWFRITPTTQILTTQQIIIEFPTKSTAGLNLFTYDLSTGLSDGSFIKVDIIGGTFSNTFMKCRLFHGDVTYAKSAKIVCGQFSQSIQNTELLFFAIKITNPALSNIRFQVSIPLFVYSVQQGKTYKKNFNVYENAVFLRSDVYTANYQGDISTSSLQSSSTSIELIARNYFDLSVGDYYVMFFGFPLRRNGVFSDGCTNITGTVYGNAYYHENIWVIVCQITASTISSSNGRNSNNTDYGYNSRNLKILGFYTPWYYLSPTEKKVITYAYVLGNITSKGQITDEFPNAAPKSPSNPTFIMTALHSNSPRYLGSRDDYTFQIIYSSISSVDISYMKKIAIIFPDPSSAQGNNFKLVGQDCIEAPGSQIQIQQCWIQTGGRIIWIRPVIKTSYTSNMRLRIQTRDLAIRNPTVNLTLNMNKFVIKYYSWQNITQPTVYPLSNDNYCFLIIYNNTLASSTVSFSYNPSSYSINTFDYIQYPHQRFYQQTPYQTLSHRAPFELKFIPYNNFPSLSLSNYHMIKLIYPSSFSDVTMFKIRDLQIFKPICYLNNFRIRKCSIDTVNNFIMMNFQFALTANTTYYIKFSILDPRNQDINGFLASNAIEDIVLTYQLSGQTTIYYMQSDQFPTLFTLPTGFTSGPFRSFTSGTVQYGSYIADQLNVINLKLQFNRTDITGLVFQIPLIDSAGTKLYPTTTKFNNAFFNLQNGASYPCGNNGFSAGGNVKCYILNGDNTKGTVPTRIIMTDFTYVSQMNCRLLFNNPETTGAYFNIRVKAYGGTKSESNLYGDKFMGEWEFMDIFQVNTGTINSNTYYRNNYKAPNKSPWRNDTTDYVFSKDTLMSAGRMSVAKVLLYDSGSSYSDKQICLTKLGSNNNYDDLLQYTSVISGRTQKYAYFVRTWPSNTNVSYTLANGWDLSYLKCKFYKQSHIVYYYYNYNQIEIATNSWNISSNQGSYGSVSNPVVKYFDQSYRLADGTNTYFTVEIDYTATINSISSFEFRSQDAMVLNITLSNYSTWNDIASCQLLGGIISTSQSSPAYCQRAGTNHIRILNIAGFQTDPLLNVSSNKRVKFLFKATNVTDTPQSSALYRVQSSYLYANNDASSNGLQPIFSINSDTLPDNCAYPNNSCYYSYIGGGGYFSLDYLSDTNIRVTFKPSGNPNFGTSISYNHHFRLQFHGFGFGTCSISKIDAEMSMSATPGTGTNNTFDFENVQCQNNRIHFEWTTDRQFSDNWGDAGPAADNIWANTQYLIVYITLAPGTNQDLPVMHHQYIYMYGSYNYDNGGNQTYQVRANSYLPVQILGTSASISTLTDNRGAVTELMMEVKGLKTSIGSTNTNYLLLAEFVGSTTWTGINDPFSTYTNTAKNKQKISCKCLSGNGPLSSSTTSPFVDATCTRRLPTTISGRSFTTYAILIDYAASTNNDIRCYFPQFYITAGMSFSVQFKTIYGDSYPYDILGSSQYGSMYKVTSNTLTFSGSTPSMSSPSVYGWTSISDNFYSGVVTVDTKFSSIYSLTGNWNGSLSTPYIYINFFKAGPVPVFSFCSDSNIYSQCRIYKSLINVVIAKFKSSSVNNFTMTQGSDDLYYPSSQAIDSSFNGFIYVGTSSWVRTTSISRTKTNLAPISSNKFLVFSDKYGSKRYNYNTNILISMNINGKKLYNYLNTGSKIQVIFSSITQLNNCQVWVQNQLSVQLQCIISSGSLTVVSRYNDYSTSNNIFVSLGITNPNAASRTFTMRLYDYWYSSSRNSIVIEKTATYTIDNSYASSTQLQKSRLTMYPFKSKQSITSNAPLRVRFKVSSTMNYQYGRFTIVNAQIQYSSAFLCYLKQYTNFKNMIQQTQYNIYTAASCTSSSTNLYVEVPKSLIITTSNYYQLIIMPIGISSTQCTAVGCHSQSGFLQSNFQQINFIAYINYATSTISNQQLNKRYQYQGSTMIGLQHIYYLSGQPNKQTSLYIAFNLNFTSSIEYPQHYIEITFFDLNQASFVGYTLNDIIPCQLSTNFLSINNRNKPQCRLTTPDTVNGYVRIRIQNFGFLSVANYWISLDDIVLPTVSGGDVTAKFDISIGYFKPSSNLKYQNIFREIFLIDGTNLTANNILSSLSFTNPSATSYGSPLSTSLTFNWPFDSSASDYQSKISININGGYSATWSDIDSVTFTQSSIGTYLLLWVNKKLNKFVFKIPNKANNVATTLYLNNMKNPYPYQRQIYNVNNNLQINFYNTYYLQTRQEISQPLFTYFTLNPSLIYINQNLPSNTLDNYPSTQKIAPNALTKLILSLAFDLDTSSIILRKLDIIDIKFSSGLSYIEDCKAMRNNSLHVNQITTCQTYYDGSNWHIKLYDITGSQLDINWWVQVFAKFSTATLSYTLSIMPSNLVTQYTTTYITSISSYFNSSKLIPTVLQWPVRKYVSWFYENQHRLVEAVSSQSIRQFRFRFTVPATFDGTNDYLEINLPKDSSAQPFRSKTQTSKMICNFLPAISAQNDFSVGYYSKCSLSDVGTNLQFKVQYIHGGLTQDMDMLFMITQANIIDSSFYYPQIPTRTLIRTHLYRYQGIIGYDYYDAFFIQSYRYFRKVQIKHITTTVSQYDSLKITYTPQGSLSEYATNRQIVLQLSVQARYIDDDGGLRSVYLSDGVSIQSGNRFSQIISNPTPATNGNHISTVQFSQYSIAMSPLKFSLARQPAYTDNVQYFWMLPLIKNPSTAYISLRYNLTLLQYPALSNYGIIFNHYEIINDYYTQSDTIQIFTSSISNSLRNVQTSNNVDLCLNLGSQNVNQWDVVTFKLDKSLKGLLPSFSQGVDTTNYNYYYFHTLQMVIAQKKSISILNNVTINSLSSSQNYQSTFGFKWLKIMNASNTKQRFNPITIKKSNPSALTLNSLTSFTASSLSLISGYQTQGSITYYLITFLSPIIPEGGEIRILFDQTLLTSNVIGNCRPGLGLSKSSNQNIALRCYRGKNGFIIAGFNAVTTATNITAYFYLKSTSAVNLSNIAVDIYGLYRENSTRITNSNIQAISHPSNSYPSTLYRIPQMNIPYYASYNNDLKYYQLEGSFVLRAANISSSSMSIYITDPFYMTGNRRLLIKKNSSSVTGWTELINGGCTGSTSCRYYMPDNYNIILTLQTGQQYIWRYLSENYTSYENLFRIDSYGSQRVLFEVHTGSNYSQIGYKQFIPKDNPITFTINNHYPAAGRHCVLDLTFTVDINININDQLTFNFDTNNLLYDMFEPDLQGNSTFQSYRYLDCREWGTSYNISDNRLICILYFGDRTLDPPKPAKLMIKAIKGFSGYPTAYTMRLLIANIKNPSVQNMNVGVQLNINRYCVNINNQSCPYYTSRSWYVTKSATQNLPTNVATFSSTNNIVLASSQTHTFTIPLTQSLTSNDIIYIVYPQNYQGVMPNDCTASGFNCYSFPTRRWIVLYPISTTITSSLTVNIQFMTNGYYSQAYDERFKITVARAHAIGDVFYISASLLTPITNSISMTISATQTPQIWLRNYANTAIFTINNIFMDDRIKAIYIKAPFDISSWQKNYCNASITGTIVNTYPLRFICQVDTSDSEYLKITREIQENIWNSAWSSGVIKIHAQFTIVDFNAGEPTLYSSVPTTSGAFYAFGSVNITSPIDKYYLSQTSQTISISQHLVPIISQITFDQKSFAHRVARVNNKQVFYLLLKPTVGKIYTIGQIVFKIPDQFDYPGVFTHDNCFILGRTKQIEDYCKQSRQAGQTLIKLRPSNYDQQVKIIQLGSKLIDNWFTAPQLPGNFYNMTVQIYKADSTPDDQSDDILLQKQTINISPVFGEYFDIPSIQLNNILQSDLTQSVYDLTFITGSLQIPPGASTTSTQLTSQLQFIFQNYNAALQSNIFQNDLKTGLKEADQIGCYIQTGITALENMRVKCLLHIGKNSTDKPMIKIINYDFIDPYTTIKISFAGIQSLPEINVNTLSIGVKMYYNDAKKSSTYLYILTPTLPDPTNATSPDINRNLTGWTWLFNSYFQDANLVLQPTTFVLQIYVPNSGAYIGYQYSSTSQQDQFILIKFNPKFLIDPYNKVNITCAQCTQMQIFYATGIIRFRHSKTLSSNNWWTFTFRNFPTSSYAIVNQSVKVNIQIYSDYRVLAKSSTMTFNRTVEKCTKFDFGVLSVSSLNGGQIDVQYLFSIKTNHYIPPNGVISITLPAGYGNMITNNAKCTLIGFQLTNAYCRVGTSSRVDIYLNGSQLLQTYSYKILITKMQNPNADSSSLYFIVSSYFSQNIYENKKICQNQITPPSINIKALRKCTIQWQPDYFNMYFNASYSFFISCSDQFRGDSIVYIKLSSEYSTKNKQGKYFCDSYQSSTLLNNECGLNYQNGSLLFYANLQATSQTSFSLLVNFINPINNTYSASAYISSKGVIYAQTLQQSITILSNTYITASPSSVTLMNNPKQGGLMATYIFKLQPINNFDPQNMAITFPQNFHLQQTQLTIGLSTTQNSNLFQQLNYNNIQKIINNVSDVNGATLKIFPTFKVTQNTIFIQNITNQLSSSLWTYVLVRGIKNPATYQYLNFTINYYIESTQYKALKWFYNYPLKYFISPPPNYLSIESMNVSDYDLLYPSVYTFTFSSSDGNKVAIEGKKLSYIIVLPTFYKGTVWANTAPVCKFDQLTVESECYSYDSEIIITQTFMMNLSKLTLRINSILNPSLQTYCNTSDVTLLSQTFFKIRIIQVLTNAFLYQSSSVVDNKNCLTFISKRIPITLQYSLIMVAGLAYNITYGLTKPASNLKIKAYIQNQNGFIFSPLVVQFNDYYTLRNTTTLYLRSDIVPGTYIIKFNKYQSQTKTYFRNILPITITVISAEQTSLSNPTISINPMTVSTVGYPITVPIDFSLPSSTQMTLFMSISEEQNQTLQQYNPAFKDFKIFPKIINIKPLLLNYSFTIQHYQSQIPPPLTLNFKLTSLYPIIHSLKTSTLYLCFDQDPKFNVKLPPLRIKITNSLGSCNTKDIGKNITNIYSKSMNNSQIQNNTIKAVLPKIIKIQTVEVKSTSIKFQVSLDSSGMVYYLCLPAGQPALIDKDKQVLIAMNSTKGKSGMTISSALSIYSGSVSQINYKAYINISNLSPKSEYQLYAISQSTLGKSQIFKKTFQTNDISKGIVMKLTFSNIVLSLKIVKSLERILRISPLRIKVLTSTYQLQQMINNQSNNTNALDFVYEIVIAPDALNDLQTPEEIVKKFINNQTNKYNLNSQIPQFNIKKDISYYQLHVTKPRVFQMPIPISIHTYNCTFRIKMWQRSNIYAILIKQQNRIGNTITIIDNPITPTVIKNLNLIQSLKVPSSNQIRLGMNKDNIQLNKYSKYSGTTDNQGLGYIFFDDLQPGTRYMIYLTASSILPYEPTYLWEDNQVIRFSFITVYNQALKNQQINIQQIKKYNPSLAAAIKKFQQNHEIKDKYNILKND